MGEGNGLILFSIRRHNGKTFFLHTTELENLFLSYLPATAVEEEDVEEVWL